MKKKNLVKALTITLCLTIVFSTTVLAKGNNTTRERSRGSVCAIVPHPTEDNVQD